MPAPVRLDVGSNRAVAKVVEEIVANRDRMKMRELDIWLQATCLLCFELSFAITVLIVDLLP